MTELPHDKVKPFSKEGEKKKQVGEMFDLIAPRYDFMNRFLSLRIDVGWRKKAIRLFRKDTPKWILDVATGTGDMAILAARHLTVEKIIGIDISDKMMEIGRQKIEKEQLSEKIELDNGDAETINFAGNTFDGVMVAFGVRNFANLERGLAEILRVMKPGAQLVVLECTKPKMPIIRVLFDLYMKTIAPSIAGWFHQNKKAYQYLNNSIDAFPSRKKFIDILNKAGYSDTYFKTLSLGTCCIYSGRKPK